MNPKRVVGITLTVIVLLLLAAGIRMAQSPGVAAEAPRVPQVKPAAQPQRAEQAVDLIPVPNPQLVATPAGGAVIQETFTLGPGWNAIYLGVEPINPSDLVDANKPELGHVQSLMQAVFEPISDTLDSVWTYTQPVSNKDYIVDPGEGLWDEPGWLRYVPETNVGPDGESRHFLSTLFTLHANTGYLVKMPDDLVGTKSVSVSGRPVPGHHRWVAGAYNLSGFPVPPGQAPTVGSFIVGTPAPIVEVRKLTVDGRWMTKMDSSETLTPGMAYLVLVADDAAAVDDYTAPLDLASSSGSAGLPSEGLAFEAGAAGNKRTLWVRNLAGAATQVTLRLKGGSPPPVALHYQDTTDANDLTQHDLLVNVPAEGLQLDFIVPTAEQPAAGEALLEISALGASWMIPVSAEPGSYAGLWVGDVVVNDVSEARLGATTFTNDLTVALAPANASGVRGATQMHYAQIGIGEGAYYTLFFTTTLSLPAMTAQAATHPTPTGRYVHGYVFIDANQNGQRDAGEIGLAGATVTVQGEGSVETLADGSYLVDNVSEGAHTVSVTGDPLTGYTGTFNVTIPAANAEDDPVEADNAWPGTVTIETDGATSLEPKAYREQVLPPPYTLPYYDAYDNRTEPPLNFGFVREDVMEVRTGGCDASSSAAWSPALGPWPVKNGQLDTDAEGVTLDNLKGASHIEITWRGGRVACGDIVVGAPTQFSDGRGSQVKFRVILRVTDNLGDWVAELLPFYELDDKQRISSAVFLSLADAKTGSGDFGSTAGGFEFSWRLPGNDPLNPFKHKYNPDHDNLDRKFYEITDPTLYESFDLDRTVTFLLSDEMPGGDAEAAAALDWGGAVWGGKYREVVANLHKNAITAQGYFVIRHVIAGDKLVAQCYDKPVPDCD